MRTGTVTAGSAVRRGVPLLARTVVLAAVVMLFSIWSTAALPTLLPRASAGEPGEQPFLQIRIDRVSPKTQLTSANAIVGTTWALVTR